MATPNNSARFEIILVGASGEEVFRGVGNPRFVTWLGNSVAQLYDVVIQAEKTPESDVPASVSLISKTCLNPRCTWCCNAEGSVSLEFHTP